MKIAIISHLKYPICPPFAGGLEMFTYALVRGLVNRGHDVTCFASADSDPNLPIHAVCERGTVAWGQEHNFATNERDRQVERFEDGMYDRLMSNVNWDNFDVIHNNSLHPSPLRWGGQLDTPMITTLHTPPLPRMCQVLAEDWETTEFRFVNVSRANATPWSEYLTDQTIIHNGVDTKQWGFNYRPRRQAVWFGRITPEKGTHLAIAAAQKAKLPLVLVGPKYDVEYFDTQIAPLLCDDIRYLGHADHTRLATIVQDSAVTVLTPCWDEPFGLVAAESLSCGTPVAAFARGGLTEIVNEETGRLCEPDNVSDLARGMRECLELDRRVCRDHVVSQFGIEANLTAYEELYSKVAGRTELPQPAIVEPYVDDLAEVAI